MSVNSFHTATGPTQHISSPAASAPTQPVSAPRGHSPLWTWLMAAVLVGAVAGLIVRAGEAAPAHDVAMIVTATPQLGQVVAIDPAAAPRLVDAGPTPVAVVGYWAPDGAVAATVDVAPGLYLVEQYRGWGRFRTEAGADLWAPIGDLAPALAPDALLVAPEIAPTPQPAPVYVAPPPAQYYAPQPQPSYSGPAYTPFSSAPPAAPPPAELVPMAPPPIPAIDRQQQTADGVVCLQATLCHRPKPAGDRDAGHPYSP